MAMVCKLYSVAAPSDRLRLQLRKCGHSPFQTRPLKALRTSSCMQTEAELTSSPNEKPNPKQGADPSSSLSSLDSYFTKLQAGASSLDSTQLQDPQASGSESPAKNNARGLNALNAYFNKMQTPAPAPAPAPAPEKEAGKPPEENPTDENVLSFLKELESTIDETLQNEEGETSFLKQGPRAARTFTNVVIGLNVAIFLFGLASPIQTPEMVEVPLPLLYGAKINALIADGQWWRLLTPMFLHDGLIHLALGSWALLSFGPGVEYIYGSTGFCMLYFLGGIFGNLASFFHTPIPTVGGTGPIYALVAAWAVYVIQNRNMFGKELQAGVTSDVVQKLLIMVALHLALTDALPADNWTHVGATLVGTLFGLIATPKAAELNVRVDDSDNEINVMLGEAPGLQRLTLAFVLCLGVYFCLYNFGVPASNELLFKALSHKNDPNFL